MLKLYKLQEMDKFLETDNLPRLNHGETESFNKSITTKEIEFVIIPPNKEKHRTRCFQG